MCESLGILQNKSLPFTHHENISAANEVFQVMGHHLVSIGCCEDLKLPTLNQFVNGMIQTGSWVLFDNIDRMSQGQCQGQICVKSSLLVICHKVCVKVRYVSRSVYWSKVTKCVSRSDMSQDQCLGQKSQSVCQGQIYHKISVLVICHKVCVKVRYITRSVSWSYVTKCVSRSDMCQDQCLGHMSQSVCQGQICVKISV